MEAIVPCGNGLGGSKAHAGREDVHVFAPLGRGWPHRRLDAGHAKHFLDFIMDPQNAALIPNYTRHGYAIVGSGTFMDPGFPKAPEMNIPAELKSAAHFQVTCPVNVQQIYTRIWTGLTK